MSELDAHDTAALFEIQGRGALADLYLRRNETPPPEMWEYLRGQREMTLRAMAEETGRLGFAMEVVLKDQAAAQTPQEAGK